MSKVGSVADVADVKSSLLVDGHWSLQGIVIAVQYFGCFVEFDVEAEEGDKQPVFGMVHKSELSWDFCEDARLVVKVSPFSCHGPCPCPGLCPCRCRQKEPCLVALLFSSAFWACSNILPFQFCLSLPFQPASHVCPVHLHTVNLPFSDHSRVVNRL